MFVRLNYHVLRRLTRKKVGATRTFHRCCIDIGAILSAVCETKEFALYTAPLTYNVRRFSRASRRAGLIAAYKTG